MSTDGVEKLAGWATAKGYTHELLSDAEPHGELSRELGLFSAVHWVTSRALFLIDPEGRLAYKVVYAMGSKPDYQALLDFIDSQVQ